MFLVRTTAGLPRCLPDQASLGKPENQVLLEKPEEGSLKLQKSFLTIKNYEIYHRYLESSPSEGKYILC